MVYRSRMMLYEYFDSDNVLIKPVFLTLDILYDDSKVVIIDNLNVIP